LLSCKNDLVDPIEAINISVDINAALIPSKVGNSWTYLDSLSIGDSLIVSKNNSTIVSEEFINGLKFYTITDLNIDQFGLYKYAIKNDSIFSRFLGEFSTEYFLGLILAPIRQTEVIFVRAPYGMGIIGKHIKKTYQIGKLCFSEYYEYKTMDYIIDRQETLILIPGVGVVDYYLKTNYYTSKGIKQLKHRVSLLSYNLK